MEKKVAGIIILFIVVLGFIAYTLIGELMPEVKEKEEKPAPTPTPTITPTLTIVSPPTKPAHHITQFVIFKEDDLLKARFSLEDENLAPTSSDGTVMIEIFDDQNTSLYKREFTVEKDDFKTYKLVLTGEMILAYAWTIPFSDIKKGISRGLGLGTAKLTFVTWEGRILIAEELVEIPVFTEEEIKTMYEDKYLQSALTVNQALRWGNLILSVVRMGYYTHLKYETWGDLVTDFRVDIKVKNVGTGKELFHIFDIVIIDDLNNQYNVDSSRSEFESGDIYPGVTVEGYLIFDDVPETTNIAKLIIHNIYIFDFEKDETYTLMEMYENLYLQSAVTVEQTIAEGVFSITLVRVGYFTHLEYNTMGDVVTQFRVDLIVTSIASEPEYIFPSDIVILDNLANQYNYEYGGTLELGEIYPGVTREGYVLFPALNENATRIRVIVTVTGYPEDIVYEFAVDLQ